MAKRKLRIQAKWREYDDASAAPSFVPAAPVPAGYKYLAVMGMVLFWLYLPGWLGKGGRDSIETGFGLFALCQIPLLWRWLRSQMARWR